MAGPIIGALLRAAGATVVKHVGGKGATAKKGAKSTQDTRTVTKTRSNTGYVDAKQRRNTILNRNARGQETDATTVQRLNKDAVTSSRRGGSIHKSDTAKVKKAR